eukprot:6214675-Pleurochrysis_carterae.AAC.5
MPLSFYRMGSHSQADRECQSRRPRGCCTQGRLLALRLSWTQLSQIQGRRTPRSVTSLLGVVLDRVAPKGTYCNGTLNLLSTAPAQLYAVMNKKKH